MNHWSADPRSVWIDRDGLHLQIAAYGGRWHCAEVMAPIAGDAAAVTFETRSRLDRLPANVVLGLFVYRDDTRELDVEFTQWSDPDAFRGQFAVQRRRGGALVHRFPVSDEPWSRHEIRWGGPRPVFASTAAPAELDRWEAPTPTPRLDGALVHINLWLHEARPPMHGETVEVVVSDVQVR